MSYNLLTEEELKSAPRTELWVDASGVTFLRLLCAERGCPRRTDIGPLCRTHYTGRAGKAKNDS